MLLRNPFLFGNDSRVCRQLLSRTNIMTTSQWPSWVYRINLTRLAAALESRPRAYLYVRSLEHRLTQVRVRDDSPSRAKYFSTSLLLLSSHVLKSHRHCWHVYISLLSTPETLALQQQGQRRGSFSRGTPELGKKSIFSFFPVHCRVSRLKNTLSLLKIY